MEPQYDAHEQTRQSSPIVRTSEHAKVRVEQLGLGVAARVAAQAAGLLFANDLAAKTESELKVLGLRSREIRNIADRLSLFGLSLAMTPKHSTSPVANNGTASPSSSLLEIRKSRERDVGPLSGAAQRIEKEGVLADQSTDDVFVLPSDPARPDKGSLTDDERALRRVERAKARGSEADLSLIDRLRHKATMTVEEAAQLYGCSRNTAYRECKLGRIPTLKKGRAIRVITALVFAELHLKP